MKLFSESKHLLSTNVSAIGTGTVYLFAFENLFRRLLLWIVCVISVFWKFLTKVTYLCWWIDDVLCHQSEVECYWFTSVLYSKATLFWLFFFALNYLFDSCFAITVVESNLSMAIWINNVFCHQSEEAERYWFAFVLYSVRRLSESDTDDSSQGNGQNEFTLCQILRLAKLKYVSLYSSTYYQFLVNSLL